MLILYQDFTPSWLNSSLWLQYWHLFWVTLQIVKILQSQAYKFVNDARELWQCSDCYCTASTALTGSCWGALAEQRPYWSTYFRRESGRQPQSCKYMQNDQQKVWLLCSKIYLVTWPWFILEKFVPSRHKRMRPRLKWFSTIFMENKALQSDPLKSVKVL